MTVAVIGWVSVTTGTRAMLAQQSNALEAVRTSRTHFIENYFRIIRGQIVNFAGEQFGADRLRAALAEGRDTPLEPSIDAAVAALRCWRGGHPFTDDVTMLAVERSV